MRQKQGIVCHVAIAVVLHVAFHLFSALKTTPNYPIVSSDMGRWGEVGQMITRKRQLKI